MTGGGAAYPELDLSLPAMIVGEETLNIEVDVLRGEPFHRRGSARRFTGLGGPRRADRFRPAAA
jgi:hypothetical protein